MIILNYDKTNFNLIINEINSLKINNNNKELTLSQIKESYNKVLDQINKINNEINNIKKNYKNYEIEISKLKNNNIYNLNSQKKNNKNNKDIILKEKKIYKNNDNINSDLNLKQIFNGNIDDSVSINKAKFKISNINDFTPFENKNKFESPYTLKILCNSDINDNFQLNMKNPKILSENNNMNFPLYKLENKKTYKYNNYNINNNNKIGEKLIMIIIH